MQKVDFMIKELTEDYPVEGYTKKDGTKVKAHKRGIETTFTSLGLERKTKKPITHKEPEKEYEIPKYLKINQNLKARFNLLSEMIKFANLPPNFKRIGESLKFRHPETVMPSIVAMSLRIPNLEQLIEHLRSKSGNKDILAEALNISIKVENMLEAIEFGVKEGSIPQEEPKTTFTSLGLKRKIILKDFIIKPSSLPLTYDLVSLKEFTNISEDFNSEDFTVLYGPITRAGPFPYEKNGKTKIYYKQWDNIKDVFSKLDYIPLIGSKYQGAHYAETIGFAYNFIPNHTTKQMFADIITLKEMDELTDAYKPEGEGWEVSIGFKDLKFDNIQIIKAVDHLATALRNQEKGRCRELGAPCYMNYKETHDQNLTEVA